MRSRSVNILSLTILSLIFLSSLIAGADEARDTFTDTPLSGNSQFRGLEPEYPSGAEGHPELVPPPPPAAFSAIYGDQQSRTPSSTPPTEPALEEAEIAPYPVGRGGDNRVELPAVVPVPSKREYGFYALGSVYDPKRLRLPGDYFDTAFHNKDGVWGELGLEWLPLPWVGGTLGFGNSISGYWISGKEFIVGPDDIQTLDLVILGAYSTLTYQLDIFHNQPIVPWAQIAHGYNLYKQISRYVPGGRSDFGKRTHSSWFWSVGGKILLDWLEPRVAKNADASYGLNNTYLIGMYRRTYVKSGNTTFDHSGEMWLAGLNLEF
ncbi:hypothetical protein ACFLRA_02335 [Bdellovibrionota bacterium]